MGKNDETEAPAKKAVQRRSVWVCVPLQYTVNEDGMPSDDPEGDLRIDGRPSKYAIEECPGGKGQKDAIRAVLTKYNIDPTNFGDVLMFRANPMRFEISQQISIKF